MHYTFAMGRDVEPSLCRILVEQAPEAIIFFDPPGIVRVWNQRATELFGYTADEVVGKSFGTIIRNDFHEEHWQGIHDAVLLHHTKFGTRPIATRAFHNDGGKRYVEFAFSIVIDELVRVVGFIASARDITQLYLAQRAALMAEVELHGNRPRSAANVETPAEPITPFILD